GGEFTDNGLRRAEQAHVKLLGLFLVAAVHCRNLLVRTSGARRQQNGGCLSPSYHCRIGYDFGAAQASDFYLPDSIAGQKRKNPAVAGFSSSESGISR